MAHYEPGDYKALVKGQRFGETKNGVPFFALDITPIDGENLPSEIYDRDLKFFLSEKAYPYALEKLRHLGWEGHNFTDLDPATGPKHDFKNQVIEVVCSHNGDYDQFDLKGPDGGGGERKPPASDTSVAAKLNATFGKSLVADAAKRGVTQSQVASAAVEVGTDADIPF